MTKIERDILWLTDTLERIKDKETNGKTTQQRDMNNNDTTMTTDPKQQDKMSSLSKRGCCPLIVDEMIEE